jgi:hypothetical protein
VSDASASSGCLSPYRKTGDKEFCMPEIPKAQWMVNIK